MHCCKCEDNLCAKPKINVEGQIHCFRCAKKEEADRSRVAWDALSKDKLKKEIYDEKKSEFNVELNEWTRLRDEYCRSGAMGCHWWIALAATLALLSALVNLGCVWVGAFIAFVWYVALSGDIRERRLKEFSNQYPIPVFSESAPTPSHLPRAMKHHVVIADVQQIPDQNYRKKILNRDDYTCQCCGNEKSRRDLEVHHVMPRSKGGTDDPTNLITLCKHCHDREEWYGHRRAFPTTLTNSRYQHF